jgi:acyl-CoA thioester hydrolase
MRGAETKMTSPLLPGYPVVIEIAVAWGEMDAFQHVNNVAYFRYFESARIAYFDQLGAMSEMERNGCGPILAETRCRFRAPLEYPDRLAAGARVTQVSDDRFTMQYAVASTTAGGIAAEGDGIIVWYDYRAQGKTRLPESLRDRIAEIERSR